MKKIEFLHKEKIRQNLMNHKNLSNRKKKLYLKFYLFRINYIRY